jgi:glycosyltransferase involved in cell wall biosynthesis
LGDGRIPFVSLLIDLLHREVPKALPEVEVAHRERFFADACARAAAVQVVSDDVAERLVEGFGLQRDRLFRTWLPLQQIDVELKELAYTVPAGSFFLYPANIWPHKNHRQLLEAFRGFLDRMPMGVDSWSLVLTGSGPDTFDLLDSDILRLGLQDRVLRLGYLNRSEYLATMRAAHALVYPSLNEGFGIPVLEAQRAGIPVACSDRGSLPEVAGDGALFFDPSDVEAMAMALVSLATDDEIRKSLVSFGRLNLGRFDFETEANRFARRLGSEARAAQSRRRDHET